MTHVMAKGANIPLTAAAVRAVLRWTAAPGTPDVDASALLIGADGKVRSDTDFVFYNQPRHPSGLVRHRPKQTAGGEVWDSIEVDLDALPADVERVVLAGSAEGGAFPAVAGLRVLLYDAAGGDGADALAEFTVSDTGEVTALVAAELYRRSGGWKFRAVGQGYDSGLGGLATDYGIAVEEDTVAHPATEPPVDVTPDPAPQPAPAEPAPDEEPDTYTLAPATPTATAPVPPPPTAPPTVPPPAGYGYPQQQPAPAAYGYPPQPQPQPQPQPAGYGYPQPSYGYPQAQPQPQPPAYGYPQHQPAPQAPAPAPQPGFALPPQGPQFQPR